MAFGDKILLSAAFLICIAVLFFSGCRYMMVRDIKECKTCKMLMLLSMFAMGCLLFAESIARHNDISIVGTLRNILSQRFTSKEIVFVIVATCALLVIDRLFIKIKGLKK